MENATFSLEHELEKTAIDRRVTRDGRKTPNLSAGYAILLGTLRNGTIISSVVNKGMVEEILDKLDDYDPKRVKRGKRRLQNILERVDKNVRGDSSNKDSERKLLGQFCKGAYEGAVYLAEYQSWEHFQREVERNKTHEAQWQFACSMGKRIVGIGPTLACSFLKDSGFLQYAKPDTQVRKQIREATGKLLSEKEAFMLICEAAEELGVTPYALDKMLWLMKTGIPAFMLQAMEEFREAIRDC